MKSLFITFMLLIPAISFSTNCIEVEKAHVISINSERNKPFIKVEPQCSVNFLALTVYDRWGNKKIAETITTTDQLLALNKRLNDLPADNDFKEGTYFAMVKYTYLGNTDTTKITASITILK